MKRLFTVLMLLVFVVACSSGDSPTPTPNQPPVAAFTASPMQGTAPLTVSFDASASNDPDGEITSYTWNFGDDATGEGVTAEHTFTNPGSYTVSLTVTDDDGATNTAMQTITVDAPAENQPPVVSVTATPSSGDAPLEVTFTATASDPDGDALSYAWDFGDGNTGDNAASQIHTYSTAGVYIATVTVSDGQGGMAEASISVTVQEPVPSVVSISVALQEQRIDFGASTSAQATVEVINNAPTEVMWSSSDVNIATVNNEGTVTAVRAGTASIIATSVFDSSKSGSALISVRPQGCVNINTASTADLRRIIHIDAVRAQEIVLLRPFPSVQSMDRISGIGPSRLRDIIAQGLACV